MLATWNVRGLNASEKQCDVMDFVYKNKLGLVGLLETKLRKDKLASIHSIFSFGTLWIIVISIRGEEFGYCGNLVSSTAGYFVLTCGLYIWMFVA